MKKMHLYIDEELKGAKTDKQIQEAIKKGFEKLEQEWVKIAQASFHNGFPKAGSVGSCGLVAIVHNNKLYVANAGDSKAVMLRQKNDGEFERIKVSKTFNANKKYEQERLKSQYPKEKDIVICKSKDACYIKGRLMPSRALGDLHLKLDEFNFHNYSYELGYRTPIRKENYSGKYISSEPDVQVFEITNEDKFLVLASDGLWDELNRKKSAVLTSELADDPKYELNAKTLSNKLMNECLDIAAKKQGITRQFLG